MVPSLHHLENERHRSVNDYWSCILGKLGGNSLQTVRNEVLTVFVGKEKVTCSLPHLEDEHQWSVNDCWPCIMVNPSAKWSLLSIYVVLTAFVGQKAQEYLVVAV